MWNVSLFQSSMTIYVTNTNSIKNHYIPVKHLLQQNWFIDKISYHNINKNIYYTLASVASCLYFP